MRIRNSKIAASKGKNRVKIEGGNLSESKNESWEGSDVMSWFMVFGFRGCRGVARNTLCLPRRAVVVARGGDHPMAYGREAVHAPEKGMKRKRATTG